MKIKRLLNKKGQGTTMSLEELIKTVLWVIVFFIVIGFVYLIIKGGSDLGKESICRDSVLLRSKSDIKFGDTNQNVKEKVLPLLCSPIEKGVLKGKREEIKAQIAKLAAKCWWMYAEGTITDLFKNEQDEKGCNVCYFFKIEGDLDEGIESKRKFFAEKGDAAREKNPDRITAVEMYNYLIDYDYNPSLAYGGGTKKYFGDDFEFTYDHDLKDDEIVVRDMKKISDLSSSAVLDYTGKISKQVEEEINKASLNMYNDGIGLLYVIVADEFKRNDLAEVRRLIERLELDSSKNSYDATIITIDLSKEQVRLTMGIDLEQYINEFELQELLKKHFGTRVNDINPPLLALVKDIKNLYQFNENAFFKENSIGQKSYYAYLTNQGTTTALIGDIEAGKTYTVSYVSSSNELSYWDGFWQEAKKIDPVLSYIVGGTGAAIIAAALIITLPATVTVSAVVAAAGVFAGIEAGTIGSVTYAAANDNDLATGLFALMGDATKAQPNFILISQLADTSAHCRVE